MTPNKLRSAPEILIRRSAAPVHSCELFATTGEACACPTGTIELVTDPDSGLISNRCFDAGTQAFTGRYEETQAFSAHFSAYARSLAERLIADHRLTGQHILEIGCGKGYFLIELCRLAGAVGTGIDPSVRPERFDDLTDVDVTFLAERLGEQHHAIDADFVICRHTLEHINDPRGFLDLIRQTIGQRPEVTLYIDVPDATRILREGAFWDVYYEHCNYFTPASLAATMEASGFMVTNLHREYDEQFLCVEAVCASSQPSAAGRQSKATGAPPEHVIELTHGFHTALEDQRDAWQAWFAERAGQRIVLWGAGSKAVAFLCALDLREEVSHAVDINPYKAGTFLAKTGQPIVAPSSLELLRPDHVVIMNPVYASEISANLSKIGISPVLWSLGELPLRPLHVP